jgi:DNA-directed RNA polymerase subunit RPC12/RpoP
MVLYKCDKCNKEFNQKSNYIIHTNRKKPCNINDNNKIIINEKKILYKCDKCNKEFNQKSNYLTHINRKIPCNNNISIDNTIALGHKIKLDNNNSGMIKFSEVAHNTIYPESNQFWLGEPTSGFINMWAGDISGINFTAKNLQVNGDICGNNIKVLNGGVLDVCGNTSMTGQLDAIDSRGYVPNELWVSIHTDKQHSFKVFENSSSV